MPDAWPRFLMLIAAITRPTHGAIYLHAPRGSNNKLNEVSNTVENPTRLFASHNHRNGGYQVGDACKPSCSDGEGNYNASAPGAGEGEMYFYEGSELEVEMTVDSGCGRANQNMYCTVVVQYMCEDSSPGLRNGRTTERIPDTPAAAADTQYGMHESLQFYTDCATRSRNKGLYTADQVLTGDSAIHTRQNPNGSRSGLECPEERDYYPYWHPTPWRDIAILTDETAHCHTFKTQSQNVRDYGMCCDKAYLQDTGECRQLERSKSGIVGPNTFAACESDQESGVWVESGKWGTPPPICQVSPYARENQLANADSPHGTKGSQQAVPTHLIWNVPGDVLSVLGAQEARCIMRVRYNITTSDFDPWTTSSLYNGDNTIVSSYLTADFIGFNNVDLSTRYSLKLSIDSSQLGHTFEDRSHTFLIRRRPTSGECRDARIHNLNVKGRRGDIVQVFPSLPYDFTPGELEAYEGDCVHIQWTGSDANPPGNAGNGRAMTDRTNLVELPAADLSIPARHGYLEAAIGSASSSRFTSVFPDEATARHMAYLDQDVDCVSPGNCVASNACDDMDFDEQSGSNCKVLNAASAYFDGGLVLLSRPGVYPYFSTRNHAFGSRHQKGLIVVQGWLLPLYIGLGVAGAVLFIAVIVLIRWRLLVAHSEDREPGAFSRGFLYLTNTCFGFLEDSVLFRYPFTILLLVACGVFWAIGYWKSFDDPDEAPYYAFAKGHGRCLDLLCNLIFLPMLRNLSSWMRMTPMGRVLPVDDSLYFHKLIGALILFHCSGHITFHYIDFYWHSMAGTGDSLLEQTLMKWNGISGHLTLLCMVLMMATGLERFRRGHWGIPFTKFSFSGHSLFVRIHKLWLIVLILLWSHSKRFWEYSLFPVVLIIFDKLIGRMRGLKQVEMVAAEMPAKDVLHITMRPIDGRRFKFQAGQYLFLQCPQVSKTEWHPFTISSSPWEATFSVHIKCRKDMDWAYGIRKLLTSDAPTNNARQTLEEKFDRSSKPMVTPALRNSIIAAPGKPLHRSSQGLKSLKVGHRLYVDGPYGTPSENVTHYSVMMLVAAGVGVTPFASILKTLAYQAKNGVLETPLKKVAFFWTCRNADEFNSFRDILVGICEDPYLGSIFELNTYLTGEINLKSVTANQLYHQYAGRPDWNRVGRRIGEEFPEDDIGVFLCGPMAIAHQLSTMCKKMNGTPSKVRNPRRMSDAKRPRQFTFFKENF